MWFTLAGYDGNALQAWPVVFPEVVPLRNVWLRCWDLRRVNTVAVSWFLFACWGAPLWGDWDGLKESEVGFLTKKIIPLEYEALFKWIVSSGKNIPWYCWWWKNPANTPVEAGHWSFIFRCPFIDQQQHVCLIRSMMSISWNKKHTGKLCNHYFQLDSDVIICRCVFVGGFKRPNHRLPHVWLWYVVIFFLGTPKKGLWVKVKCLCRLPRCFPGF